MQIFLFHKTRKARFKGFCEIKKARMREHSGLHLQEYVYSGSMELIQMQYG